MIINSSTNLITFINLYGHFISVFFFFLKQEAHCMVQRIGRCISMFGENIFSLSSVAGLPPPLASGSGNGDPFKPLN